MVRYTKFSKMSGAAVLIVASLLLCGCATIISGTSQTINVQAITADTHKVIPKAACTLKSAKGIPYPVSGNPGQVTVPRWYGGMQALCVAKGYQQRTLGVGAGFNAWTLLDLLFWPSLIVDAATGAVVKYPSRVTVLMHKNGN